MLLKIRPASINATTPFAVCWLRQFTRWMLLRRAS